MKLSVYVLGREVAVLEAAGHFKSVFREKRVYASGGVAGGQGLRGNLGRPQTRHAFHRYRSFTANR